MNQLQHIPGEENIDIKKYLFKFLSVWYLFILSVSVSLLISWYINRSTLPVYNLSATIVIKDEANQMQSGVESVLQDMGFRRRSYRRSLENEVVAIKSFNLIRNTISKLDFEVSYYSIGRLKTPEIYKSAPFVIIKDSGTYNPTGVPIYINILNENEYKLEIKEPYNFEKKLKFGDLLEYNGFKFWVNKSESISNIETYKEIRYYFIFNNLDALASAYKGKLNVGVREKNTMIIDLSTTGNVPDKESDFLNRVAQEYITSTLDEKNLTIQNTLKFIDNQIDVIRDSLKEAEKEMLDFRLKHKINDVSNEGQQLFDYLKEYQVSKSELTLQMHYYNYLDDYIKSRTEYSDIIAPSVMGVTEPGITSYLSKITDLYAEKVRLQLSSKIVSPKIYELNNEIDGLKKLIVENIRSLKEATELRIKEIDRKISESETILSSLPAKERNLIKIKRNYTLNDNIYNFLLQKRAESGIIRASNTPDAKLIEKCRPENASQILPKKSSNYTIALVIGLLIPIGFVYLRELLNDKIMDKSDIDRKTTIPVLGIVSHNSSGFEIPVFEKPKSSMAESFRSLRTNLQYFIRDKEKKVIAITSTISGEGKTFCAINLAAILAISNKKVLIAGLDLRRPKLHTIFNINNDKGISTYLIDRDQWSEIIFSTHIPNLFVATSGPVPPNPAELIETQAMHNFLEKAKSEYDYVILDTPPLAIVTDAFLLATETDANLFVIRQNYSSKHVFDLLNDLYAKKELKNFCILINDLKSNGLYGYKYGYGYGYHYGYGYSYGYNKYYGNQSHGYYSDEETETGNWMKRLFKKG